MKEPRRGWSILAVLAAVALGCSTETSVDTSATTPGRIPTQRERDAVPPTASVRITPEARPVTLAFAGDVHFEGELRSLLDDPDDALSSIAAELSAADLTIVNFESSIGTGGDAEPKRFTFQAPPTSLDALAAAGVDVVSVANNHAADYGLPGLESTIGAGDKARTADPPIAVVGIGRDAADAHTPATFDIDGTSVAVFGASAADHDRTADPTGHWAATSDRTGTADALDPVALTQAIDDSTADVVVVYLHWGVQGESCPSAEQETLAATLASAGADIVVGSHSHRLQGAGLLGDAYIAYGLGNFVWYTQASEATTSTGVLTLTVDPSGQVTDEQWAPARIAGSGLPEFVTGGEADQMRRTFSDLRDCTDLTPMQ